MLRTVPAGERNAIGDKNLSDHAYGCLQRRKPYVDGANGYIGTSYKAQAEACGNAGIAKATWVEPSFMAEVAYRDI